jgi:dTDP-4-amino-4,6-dideoxygalactose transaminase
MSEHRRKIQISRPLLPRAEALLPELREMFESGQLTNGAQVRRFEAMVREYLGGSHHVVAVSSNTTGMLLCWRALGVRGEVLLPAFTFPATAHVLAWNGLEPVLVDCDPETFNIDLADARRKVTRRTVGIAPVYIFGNSPDWPGIEAFASEHSLKCVSDAAHAFGTRVGDRFAGTFGDAEVFSLAPTKVLTTGEGGLIVTRDAGLADVLRRMRNYGNPGDYNCRELGLKSTRSWACTRFRTTSGSSPSDRRSPRRIAASSPPYRASASRRSPRTRAAPTTTSPCSSSPRCSVRGTTP